MTSSGHFFYLSAGRSQLRIFILDETFREVNISFPTLPLWVGSTAHPVFLSTLVGSLLLTKIIILCCLMAFLPFEQAPSGWTTMWWSGNNLQHRSVSSSTVGWMATQIQAPAFGGLGQNSGSSRFSFQMLHLSLWRKIDHALVSFVIPLAVYQMLGTNNCSFTVTGTLTMVNYSEIPLDL